MSTPGRIIAVVIALLALVALAPKGCAQAMLPHRHGASSASSSSWTPQSLSNIRYYWVSGDVTTNVAITTQWTDRIQTNIAGQATAPNQPTNSASGVHFSGTPVFLTNATFAWGLGAASTGTVWTIIAPITPASTFGGLITTDDTSGYGLDVKNDGHLTYFGTGGSGNVGTYVSSATMEVAIVFPANLASRFYTNGILSLTNTWGVPPGSQKFFGKDGEASPLYGKAFLLEAAWFSNALTQAEITLLHNYATNRYGYTP